MLLIHVWDRGASYPLTIDPLIQQGNKLVPSDETGAGKVGYAVTLSADGNTALIGGPRGQQQRRRGVGVHPDGYHLDAAGRQADRHGRNRRRRVRLRGGAVGGREHRADQRRRRQQQVGAAWVFTRTAGVWTQESGKLTGTNPSGQSGFGFNVALSADGNTALIGGPNDGFLQPGAAWVFTRTAGVWTQQGNKLTAGGFLGWFGSDVALSADGNTALIGATLDSSNIGAAWVFTRSAGVWSQQGGKLTATGETGNGNFGWSVALSADGNLGLIGAPADNSGSGKVFWFARSGGTWSQLTSSGVGTGVVGNARFGSSVAMSSDGSVALIGGNEDGNTGNGNKVGAAWLLTRSGNTWSQQGAKLTGGGEVGPAEFGYAAALSSDGNTALIGGHHDNTDVGAAWVFATPAATVPDPPTAVTATGGDGQASVSFTPPASNGGAAIDSYTVTSSPEGKTATGAGSPLVVTGLTNGVSYTFTVTAHNSVGNSAPSAASNAVVPAGPVVPGAPTGATATPGNGQASVAFTAPASNGGAAITSYTVTSSPEGKTATGAGSPLVVNGLTNGTSYTFTVTAHNVAGDGAASAPSAAVTPRTVPGAPTGVSATPADAQASVSFSAPASNGGATITSYTVTSSPEGRPRRARAARSS